MENKEIPGINPNEERDQEYYGRTRQEEWARGTPSLEALKSATSPELVISTVTEILVDFENLDKSEAYDRYSLKPYYQTAGERARALSKTIEELKEKRIIEPMLDKNGLPTTYEDGTPKFKTNVAGYSLGSRQVENIKTREQVVEEYKLDSSDKATETDKKVRRTTEQSTEEVPYYGTNKERRRLAMAYEAVERTMIVREKLHNLYAFAYKPNTANLSGIVENFYIKFPGFSNAQLKDLFNLPSFETLQKNPDSAPFKENTLLGQRIDVALRLFMVTTQSEKKSDMQTLMQTPGFKDVLLPFVSSDDHNAWIKEWIGDVDNWEEDLTRNPDTIALEDKGEWDHVSKKRVNGDRRGLLTRWGNLFARGGLNKEKLLVELIGEAVGDKTSAELALRIFKITGLAAEEGIVIYNNGDERLFNSKGFVRPEIVRKAAEGELSKEDMDKIKNSYLLEGDPITDDLAKLMHFRGYRQKEITKTRSGGPEASLDSVDKLTLSMFRLGNSKTKYGIRSLMEQWWGYPADGNMPAEPAKGLGEMDWEIDVNTNSTIELLSENEEVLNALEEGIWSVYGLFLYLAGRKDDVKGLYQFFYAEDFEPNSFIKRDFWRHKNKFFPIVLNRMLISNGDYRSLYKSVLSGQDYTSLSDYEREVELEIDKKVSDILGSGVDNWVSRGKKGFWSGVKSLPQWKTLWDSITVKYRSQLKTPPYLVALAEDMAKKYGYHS